MVDSRTRQFFDRKDLLPADDYTDEPISFAKGMQGDHWGSADETNSYAAAVAMTSGTAYRPLPKLVPSETPQVFPSWPVELIKGAARRVYAQKRIKEVDRTKWPSIYRGMALKGDILDKLRAGDRKIIPLTGCTAFSFDEGVAEHYSDSAWTAGLSQDGSEPVVLEVERDDVLDASLSSWKNDSSGKTPAFEVLTGAAGLVVTSIEGPPRQWALSLIGIRQAMPTLHDRKYTGNPVVDALPSAAWEAVVKWPFPGDPDSFFGNSPRGVMDKPTLRAIAERLTARYAAAYSPENQEKIRAGDAVFVDPATPRYFSSYRNKDVGTPPRVTVEDGRLVIEYAGLKQPFDRTATESLVYRLKSSKPWRIKAKVVKLE